MANKSGSPVQAAKSLPTHKITFVLGGGWAIQCTQRAVDEKCAEDYARNEAALLFPQWIDVIKNTTAVVEEIA